MRIVSHTPGGHGEHQDQLLWLVVAALVLIAVAVDVASWLLLDWLVP